MNKILLIIFTGLISATISNGQGIVRGKITDEKGETLIGVAVVLKSNPSIGTISDLDGNYSLKITDSIPQTIKISFVSFKNGEELVHPVNGEVIIRNVVLAPSSLEIKEVQIIGRATRAKEYYVDKIKKNSATTLDYISSETIKRSGDNNVAAAVARVTGVSTNGSFITVRGIGDRYVKTAINGALIPTLDPFTNNIKLDIFPASLVDNIMITKTANADLPGDWAGAYLSIQTKDYPEELTLIVDSKIGYNSQSTFNDYVTSQNSKTDWLGYDNGFRNHNHDEFVSANISPTPYQEFIALGLGSYYSSLGIQASTPWNDTYFKLGLVELKLLAPAKFDDANAVSEAKNLFETGSYHSEAFKVINAGVPNSGKSLPNNWNTTNKTAPLNFSQSLSIGNQVKLFKNTLGYIVDVRYGRSVSYDPNGSSNRQSSPDGKNIIISNQATGETSKEINGWSALVNLAYKFNPNNSVSFLFMPNFTGNNNARYFTDTSDPIQLNLTKEQFYESRKQLIYQFKSENYLPSHKIKLEINASYTNGDCEAPDFKRLDYTSDVVTGIYGIGQDASRAYRYLSENVFDSHASAEFPIENNQGLTRKIKFGGGYQDIERNSEQFNYLLRYGPYSNPSLGNTGIDDFFGHDKFEISSGIFNGVEYSTLNFFYIRTENPSDHTIGYSRILSGFGMIDYFINNSLRVVGGLRVEQAEIFSDAYKYNSLNYSADDGRRQFGGEVLTLRPGTLNELSLLPSINLIYKIKNDETSPLNLRVNFSQTVARPNMRELTDVVVYDYDLRAYVYGNSDLKMVRIDNYDLRLENYFSNGDNVSLSLFYKNFKNHIEVSDAPLGYIWINVDRSQVMGLELEGRKSLIKHLEVKANLTLVNSRTSYMQKAILFTNGIKTYVPVGEVSRTMYGQAPYVVNGMLTYSFDKLKMTTSVNYNLQGPRLVISSFVKAFEVYELPRHLLDANIVKLFGKHFSISATFRDILNSSIRRSYNRDEGWILDYDKYKYGTSFILGLTYKL